MRRQFAWVGGGLSLIVLSLVSRPDVRAIPAVDEGCPQTSGMTEHQGTALESFATTGSGGVVFDGTEQSLKLRREGGIFTAATIGITDSHNASCAQDFDSDGWTDLVVAQSSNTYLYYYRNRTFENAAPDWTNSSAIRTPKFILTTTLQPASTTGTQHAGLVCGDYNGDGNADVLYYRADGASPTTGPNIQRLYLGNGNGTFQAQYAPLVTPSQMLIYAQTSTNAVSYDYNQDGWLDIMYGGKKTSSNSTGAIVALLNNCPDVRTPGVACSTNPRFVAQDVITGQNFGVKGINALTVADFNGDGRVDLMGGSPSQCSAFSLWLGISGGFSSTPQMVPSVGGASALMSADFSLDGKPDMAWGRDGFNCSTQGGKSYYYRNNGTATPFSGGFTTQLSEYNVAVPGTGVSLTDLDLGVVLDYDHDPDRTPDAIIADGNNSGQYLLFANRVISQYVACGDVASGVVDLGDLSDDEMVVTAARLSPTMVVPSGTSVTFYMSNEDPPAWQTATPCADDATDYCVSFPSPVGRWVRWKATMCSNTARTITPTISEIELNYDYTLAEEHFRGGVVVDDGVAYVGAFRQPGDRGHFYATNAGLTRTYWDAGDKLDDTDDDDRTMYTATSDGTERLDFDVSETDNAELRQTLGVASAEQAQAVIEWQRSARFGIAGGAITKTRLGAIETSTPAVISPPTRPLWYPYLSTQAQQEVDVFTQKHQNRPVLVLFGSKDGPLHAVRNQPDDIEDSNNGTEAWAYVPARVAASLVSDKASGTATAFVDGSPALADVRLSDGKIHTVAIVSGGNGSSAVFALDVTDTVNPASGNVAGPRPLWEIQPGDELAGQGRAKPAIARVRIAGNEKYIAILATGLARDNPNPPYSKGRDVMAVDVATGARLWRFRTACPVTSDPVVFETDDDAEPGGPELDGYVYKLDPAVSLSGQGEADGWLDSSALGSIATGTSDAAGQPVEALFSTRYTADAIGGERPIAGTIGTRTDATGRVVLFFGTGGLESADPALRNEFYAVYADTGAIRNKLVGDCEDGRCEKFYGGVVVSTDQVLLTRATDPPVGTETCETGDSEVTGVDLNDLSTELAVTTSSATVSALFGHAGAVYFTTLAGDIVRVGTPVSSEAGGETGSGNGDGGEDDGEDDGEDGGEDDGGSTSNALGIMGWRQVL